MGIIQQIQMASLYGKPCANLGITQCVQPIPLINVPTDIFPFFDSPSLCSASALNEGELKAYSKGPKRGLEWKTSLGKKKQIALPREAENWRVGSFHQHYQIQSS